MLRDILIIKPSSFGDIVHALYTAEAIRTQVPEIRLHWLVRDTFAPLVRASHAVNGDIIVFERSKGIRGLFEVLLTLSQRQFDAVLDMQGLARTGLMTLAASAPLKIGRADARELSSISYHRKVRLPESGRTGHAVEILRCFLGALGLSEQLPDRLYFKADRASSCCELLDGAIVIFPDSRRPEKEWQGFPELTERLVLDERQRVVWMGVGGPRPPVSLVDFQCKAIEEQVRFRRQSGRDSEVPGFCDLRGKTTLRSLPGAIRGARLVIANDSGPMHLAAALGLSTLALFGPTDPSRFGPWPLNSPANHCLRGPDGNLAGLSVEKVLQTSLGLLS